MIYKNNGYIIAISDKNDDDETRLARDALGRKPEDTETYGYRLRDDYTWEQYEKQSISADQTLYTKDDLSAMSNEELERILSDMGVSANMTKANMVTLILAMQEEAVM